MKFHSKAYRALDNQSAKNTCNTIHEIFLHRCGTFCSAAWRHEYAHHWKSMEMKFYQPKFSEKRFHRQTFSMKHGIMFQWSVSINQKANITGQRLMLYFSKNVLSLQLFSSSRYFRTTELNWNGTRTTDLCWVCWVPSLNITNTFSGCSTLFSPTHLDNKFSFFFVGLYWAGWWSKRIVQWRKLKRDSTSTSHGAWMRNSSQSTPQYSSPKIGEFPSWQMSW